MTTVSDGRKPVVSVGGQVPAGAAGVCGLHAQWGNPELELEVGEHQGVTVFSSQVRELFILSGPPVVNSCIRTWRSTCLPHS